MTALAPLLPHAGAMVLLDRLVHWDAAGVRCTTGAHLSDTNPLRRAGRLSAICGVEFALQAAALHGALLAGGVAQRAGYVARLRETVCHVNYLDDAAFGALTIEAHLERQEARGMLYRLVVQSESGQALVGARASVALPA
jgi:predicted hotdog family 3-hydroxylacyl-ACP dehydratase